MITSLRQETYVFTVGQLVTSLNAGKVDDIGIVKRVDPGLREPGHPGTWVTVFWIAGTRVDYSALIPAHRLEPLAIGKVQ
jgi:hypothetical protein